VPTPMAHLTAETLEQLAEGMLSPAEAADALTHVEACGRCAAELEGHQQLFAALSGLPRFEPAPSFNDAVMARVVVGPRESFVLAWLRRLTPRSRRGWTLLGAAVTAPALPVLALVAWVVTQPLLSPATLWQWALIRSQGVAQATAAWLIDRAAGAGLLELLDHTFVAVHSVPTSALGGLLALLAVGIPLSGWGLLRLTRIPDGSVTYGT
jgi:anti-sigma factor RsiW